MKTPKRTPWQWTTAPCENKRGELRATIQDQVTRWKRKNKVAQLKRTITRLEEEKISAYHRGHEDGYKAGFASLMF